MKKVLGISLIAVLSALPLMAFAGVQDTKAECEAAYGTWHNDLEQGKKCSLVTDVDPGATDSNGPIAANAPKYSLKAAAATDGNVATAGYVKGAYNAAIKAINRTVDKLDDGVDGYDIDARTLQLRGEDVATQSGVVNTINHATVTSGLTGANNVSVSANVPVMDDWITDEANETGIPITATVDLSNVGVSSSISVSAYHATQTECAAMDGYTWNASANNGAGACVVVQPTPPSETPSGE